MKIPKNALLIVVSVGLWSLLSLLATDAYWIGIHIYPSVAFGRACDFLGNLFLLPGRLFLQALLEAVGGFEVVFAPRELARFNGLILGVLFYALTRKRLLGAD